MDELTSKKQSVTGFKVSNIQVKKSKDTEKLRLVLEAEVDGVGAGEFDFGDVVKALWAHQASDTDVGFHLFMEKKNTEPTQ